MSKTTEPREEGVAKPVKEVVQQKREELKQSELSELSARKQLVDINKANLISSEFYLNALILELAKKYNLNSEKIRIENGFIYET